MKPSRIVSIMLSTLLVANSMLIPINVNADSSKVVTLGEDLSEAQKETVMQFFNVTEDEVVIVTVNNEEERKYLEGIVSDSIIGKHTLSCCYINPTEDGGIQVKTANLTWVTENMLANALLTAGVDNCQVIATAPFEVSGTGALTGILKSYETASDTKLDEDKKEVATEELVISAELSDDNQEDDVLQFMNEIKNKVVSGEVTQDEMPDLINDVANDYQITLTDEQLSKLKEWLETLKGLDYDLEEFTKNLNTLNDTIKGTISNLNIDTEKTKGFFAKVWDAIVKFFSSIFGNSNSDVIPEDREPSIFDNVNTDIFNFDDESEPTETTDTIET